MAGASIPGPLGSSSNNPPIDAGTLALTATPSPASAPATAGNTAPAAAKKKYSIDDAVKHLDANAHDKSQGQCAKYVRQAIEAGGVTISLPRPLYAKDYGAKLAELGFGKIVAEGYTPQKGDIIVLQPPTGQSAGHIQMYNGSTWESDFVQGTGIYPGPAYRKDEVAYEIYRP